MAPQAAQLMKRLNKKAKRGFRGYPVATIACYGPDDRVATKLVAPITESEGADASEMRKWYAEHGDIHHDPGFVQEIVEFLDRHGARSVAMPSPIIGCPHEEGIDYNGPICPQCPFWSNRDRWTGEIVQ